MMETVFTGNSSVLQGIMKPAQNWLPENLGDCFSAESEVMDQVETSRGSSGEGRRRGNMSAQMTKRDNTLLFL